MNEIVMVPVPAHLLPKVYALLARETHFGESTDQHDTPAAPSWNAELLGRAYRESPGPMKAILGYLSDNPGRNVNADELAEKIERTRPQMAGVLGAFGRRTKNRYGQESWPFHATWDGGTERMNYKMDKNVADIIRQVRDAT